MEMDAQRKKSGMAKVIVREGIQVHYEPRVWERVQTRLSGRDEDMR